MALPTNTFDPIFAEIWGREVERAAEPALTLRRFCVIKRRSGDESWRHDLGSEV